MWHAGTYIRDETNAETKKICFQQKRNTISRNIRGAVGENWALIVQPKQRGNWPWAACRRPVCLPVGVGSDSAGIGWPVADPGCMFTSYKGESWHHNLKTFILGEGGSGKDGEKNSVMALAMSGRVEHDMGLSSAFPFLLWGLGQVTIPQIFGPWKRDASTYSHNSTGILGRLNKVPPERQNALKTEKHSMLVMVSCLFS